MSAVLAAALGLLTKAFRREKITPDVLALYLAELSDLPPAAVEAAARELIRTSDFFPTIKALREAAVERLLSLPTEAQALAQIEARMGWARKSEDARGDPPEVHPLVREALDRVGGWHAFRATDEAGVVRGQFLRLYRDLRSTSVKEAQVGDLGLPAGPARLALEPPR
ncbi:MAG: hypothetical protein ACJ79H_21705 [Myxococcales bacterium]